MIDAGTAPGALERGVGMGRPCLAPSVDLAIEMAQLGAESLTGGIDRAERCHDVGVGIAVALVVDADVREDAMRGGCLGQPAPQEVDLLRQIELARQGQLELA